MPSKDPGSAAAWSQRLQHRLILGTLALVVVRVIFARVGGLNPDSLWYDDLAWAVFARLGNLKTMLFPQNHAPPGFLAVLWAFSAVFHDPEWSMQLFPFLCGIASIPAMAGLVWRITRSDALALLAAALTALNPLLAHYTIFVKTYSVDFLVTTVLLYLAVPLVTEDEIRPGATARLVTVACLSAPISATSVLVSLAAVNVVALRAWATRQSRLLKVLSLALVFDGALLLAALWFRFWRSGGTHYDLRTHYDLQDQFLRRLAHPLWFWTFAADNWVYELARGLPSWTATEPWNPVALPWTMVWVGAGLAALFWRRSTRVLGLLLLLILGGYLVTGFTELYPLTTARRSIFMFPVVITLAVMGVHAATAWFSRRDVAWLATGLVVAAVAIYAPVRVGYWGVDDKQLVAQLDTWLQPSDGLILSPAGTILTVYYGHWRVRAPGGPSRRVSIFRQRTLEVPGGGDRSEALRAFLVASRTGRIAYLAFRPDGQEVRDVLASLHDLGYAVDVLETSTNGTLYMAARSQ